MDRYADEDDDGKYQDGLEEEEEEEEIEVAQPAKKLAKLDDEDANENDDGKALADEGYSYIRELEYQDGLMEDDEEEDDEEEDDEEAQPAKKPVKLGDKDSDEEDDSEDQPAQELEEKDADGGDEEEDQPAVSARPDAWVDGIPVYRRGKPVQSAIQGLRGGPQPQQPAVSARPDRPDAWVDGIPFYIRGRPGYKEPPRPIHPDEVGDEVNLPPGRLAEIEDMRKHLMQVRKAAEARESRRSDNAADLLCPTFRHCGHPPTTPEPMGFEVAEAGKLRADMQAFNERNYAESGGYLHSSPFRDIAYLPVTCSHTAANVLARNIGIHPSNRACTGVDPVNAQNLTQWALKWQRPGNTAHFPGQKYT